MVLTIEHGTLHACIQLGRPARFRCLVVRACVEGFVLFVAAGASALDAQRPQRVWSESPLTWFEESSATARISPDGAWAVYGSRGRYRLFNLQSGREDSLRMRGPLDEVNGGVFDARGRLVRLGRSGAVRGWFLGDAHPLAMLQIPPDALPAWSANGSKLAYVSASVADRLVVREDSTNRVYPFSSAVTGLAWAPRGENLYLVVRDERGLSSIVLFSPATGSRRVIVERLDAVPASSPIAISPDERYAYIGLASAGAPAPEVRHRPNEKRNVHLYAVDLRTGSIERMASPQTDGEDIAPVVVGNSLYWMHSQYRMSIVTLPATGGAAANVVSNGMLPLWSGDGRQIALTYGMNDGGSRGADSPLNLDAAVIQVDAGGRATSQPTPIVTGYHEDFTPAWSPYGNWIAYHSHRPTEPVFLYADPRSRDAMYIRRPWLPMDREIQLTDYGWEVGWADWASDGTRLMFSSWIKGKPPGTTDLWVLTIDTAKGTALKHEKVALPDDIMNIRSTAWSPRGDRIAIHNAPPGKPHAIWIVNSDGSNAQKRVEFPFLTYGGVDWSPDGTQLVYTSIANGRMQLFAVPVGPGEPRQLTTEAAHVLHPQFSPNGRYVAATRIESMRSLWRMPILRPLDR
jgi:Tol biopolymer transport system component